MKARRVIPRARALQDIDQALQFYSSGQARQVALKFIDALESAFEHIG